MDLSVYGTSAPFTWKKEHMIRLLTEGNDPILTNPLIINAFNNVDRAIFLPESLQNVAYMDKSLDIGYGEQSTNPSTLARILEIMSPSVGGSYLHLGTGSGYFAALLGFLAGKQGKVYSHERVMWLWQQARKSLYQFPFLTPTTSFLYRDGQFGHVDKAPFDGIVITYALQGVPTKLVDQLKPGGKLVVPLKDYTLKVIQKFGENQILEETIPGFVFSEGKVGIA